MTDASWSLVEAELSRTVEAGGRTRFWLRDDDAVEATPALDRLARCAAPAGMPILLAVIPAGAGPSLAGWLAHHPFVTPCQHGWRHANHAAAGARACELGGDRSDETVLAELAQGRGALSDRLGARMAPILVPPWNRIRPSLIPHLPAAGYAALSTFGRTTEPLPDGLQALNCDLDIIDWRNGRRGRSLPDLCGRLAKLVEAARQDGAPIGLLTHHLVHDEAAWRFLDEFFERVAGLEGVAFIDAATALAGRRETRLGSPQWT